MSPQGKWVQKWVYAKGFPRLFRSGSPRFLACTSQSLVAAAGFEPATKGCYENGFSSAVVASGHDNL
jgi:hypothetical protein